MKKIFIAVLSIATLAAIFLYLQYNKATLKNDSSEKIFSTDFAFDNKLFLTGIAKANAQKTIDYPQIRSLIVPHHLVASGLIAKGVGQLALKSPPKTIIILSPNHQDLGNCAMISSPVSWATSYGTVYIDKTNLNSLINNGLICRDDENIAVEHGIAGLLPYIKYFLPDTKILPIAFKKNIAIEDLKNLADSLSRINNSVVLASIDFSHNLSTPVAMEKDNQTIAFIKNNDIEKISKLNSDFLDSPSSLITLLFFNQKMSINTPTLLDHSDAITVDQKTSKENTSYLLYIFYVTKQSKNNWTLIATGDVMLGRSVNTRSLKKNDFTWAFLNVASLLKSADITLINLESPLVKDCKPTDAGMIFCAPLEHIKGLTYAGVDIANLANNHIYNQGNKGLEETVEVLNSNGISPVGLGMESTKNIQGNLVTFVGFDAVGKDPSEEVIKSLKDVEKNNSLIVASFHWGTEYQSKPNNKQISLAHLAVDSGADVVIGTHPHWVQTEETYKNKRIFYSLGNFIFDQMWSEETRIGQVIRLTFEGSTLIKEESFPIKIFDYGQPKIID